LSIPNASMTLKLLAVAILLSLMVIFIAENFVKVEVRLVFVRVTMRLAWSLLLAAGLGFLAGFVVARSRH
jgi:uncharacterized integral membrane protein